MAHRSRRDDLLDGVGRWGVMHTRHGDFRLQPVRLARDLALLVSWMNDPVVSAFWELCGPAELTEHHVRTQLDGDGRSVPCLGLLDGTPMSYWELYRADLDPLARHYPARPHDTGLHLLIGPAERRGRGIGGTLIGALAQRVLRERQSARRVVAEPDVRNLPSVRAFLRAGFRYDSELLLPEKHAALMVYERG
ncbi:RimJ/RimL family protein N-acetyltransferase [Streptacidiphilus sp. MAP12-20]